MAYWTDCTFIHHKSHLAQSEISVDLSSEITCGLHGRSSDAAVLCLAVQKEQLEIKPGPFTAGMSVRSMHSVRKYDISTL